MSTKHGKTLRLHMPQWQGGNMHDYSFGSRLLVWLAPPPDGPVETVPVPEPKSGKTLKLENGILGRGALIRQARAAREAIEIHRPDRIVTLGGDCLIGRRLPHRSRSNRLSQYALRRKSRRPLGRCTSRCVDTEEFCAGQRASVGSTFGEKGIPIWSARSKRM
jgi:hypothetical protein